MEKKLLQVKKRFAYSSLSVSVSPHFQFSHLILSLTFMLIDYSSSKRDINSSNEVFLPDSDFIGHGIYIVVLGSCGIPKWRRNQRKGNEITMDLPRNSLNEYDDLLEAESSISIELECQLSLHDRYGFSLLCVQHLSFRTTCKCYHDGGASEQMWVIFYPKAAILESCHTSPFLFLGALFMGSRNHFKVVNCQNLVTLPESICNLRFLEDLDVIKSILLKANARSSP
ncbi:hypothetical protein AAG906_003731 [Vitis piasezkii]